MSLLQVDTVDAKTVKVIKNVQPCILDNPTQKLIELIFSNDMFKEAMECMDLGGCVSSSFLQTSLCSLLKHA